jgi:putative nucleotidyltransferase with HDIG domain
LAESGTLESVKLPIIGLLALNVFLSFLAYPLIVFFEKMFGLITDISLVEYTDINKPLLKRLSLEARGTFQHSHQVSNLAEAAASEIRANSLLVKVGALYHDIGKMEQSIYFIENQFPDENPHSKLSYEESAKIIIAHVTDGVKLAKKYGLPQQIIEFIQTHHGTTRVEYFYRMHAKVHKDEQINDQTFKYPGPAPFRKEHAILMMADSVEAASKSLKNPTHGSLCELVDNIIDYQRSRGQFDNVPITFKEITQCKEVFKKMLASIYHIRIEYPKQEA